VTGDAKPLRWVGSTLKDVRAFPQAVRGDIGQALYAAQRGVTYASAKPLKGFGGASVLEIVAPYSGDAYRAVYTVQFQDAVYVLHAFQKKSKRGAEMPQRVIALIRQRLAQAERDYQGRRHDE
jgi:phage-related protein